MPNMVAPCGDVCVTRVQVLRAALPRASLPGYAEFVDLSLHAANVSAGRERLLLFHLVELALL